MSSPSTESPRSHLDLSPTPTISPQGEQDHERTQEQEPFDSTRRQPDSSNNEKLSSSLTTASTPLKTMQSKPEKQSPTIPTSTLPKESSSLNPNPNPDSTSNADSTSNPISIYQGQGTAESPFIVVFEPGAKDNPFNWSYTYKWFITGLVAISTLCVAFASSCYSAALPEVQKKFGGVEERGIAGISLYVLGFGVGPLLWAPISEIWGRNMAFYISYPLFTIFNLMGAVANNWWSLLFSRLLAGTFGASPLTNSGAVISDMWMPRERALATMLFALAPFLGPVLGPIVGGFVSETKGWRWVFWVQFFFALVMMIVGSAFTPETFAPTILHRKAERLTRESAKLGLNQIYVSKFDLSRKPRKEIVMSALKRPFQLMFLEPIVLSLSIYIAIIYATLYAFFTCFPIVFEEKRHWTQGEGGLAFLGIGVGLILCVLLSPIANKRYAARLATLKPGETPPPEWRLTGAMIGGVLLPIGLFWFAWTSGPSVHWIVPIIACVPFGFGFLLIFTSVLSYLIDSYLMWAASALAANAVMRAVLATVFPLFTVQMYDTLGLHWAGTLVAFLSLACTPLPFLFYFYGAKIRTHSRFAPTDSNGNPPAPPQGQVPNEKPIGNDTSSTPPDESGIAPQTGADNAQSVMVPQTSREKSQTQSQVQRRSEREEDLPEPKRGGEAV